MIEVLAAAGAFVVAVVTAANNHQRAQRAERRSETLRESLQLLNDGRPKCGFNKCPHQPLEGCSAKSCIQHCSEHCQRSACVMNKVCGTESCMGVQSALCSARCCNKCCSELCPDALREKGAH